MQGIYIIKNLINNKVYIGQSKDILRRWQVHRWLGKKETMPRLESHNQIHTAMQELGRENFYIEILEECSKEELDDREIYWISYYDSYKNGYNGTTGGSFIDADTSGEKNGRALLTEQDVIYIRECYNNHIPFREVYKLYKDKISKRGLQKVWWFDTWKHIHPEYHTEENRIWHSTIAKANSHEVASKNKKSFSEEEVREMRKLFKEGFSVQQIWKEKYPEKAKSTVYNAIKGITYKDIH